MVPSQLILNWEIEIGKFMQLPSSMYRVLRYEGSNKVKRSAALNEAKKPDNRLTFLITNYEKAVYDLPDLMGYEADMAILDESHYLKGRTSKRSVGVRKICDPMKYVLLLSGTPMANGPEDLFMQYRISDPGIFGDRFADFQDNFMVMEEETIYRGGKPKTFNKVAGYKNVSKLSRIIKRTSTVIRLSDVIELPPITIDYKTCELNKDARKHYNNLKEELITFLEAGEIDYSRKELKDILRSANIPFKKRDSYVTLYLKASDIIGVSSSDLVLTNIIKLHQLAGGFITNDIGDITQVDNGKLKLLAEEIKEATGQVLVSCNYVPEIYLVADEIPKLTGKKVGVYRGKRSEMEQTYKDFLDGKYDVLVLQPQTGSTGLNLQNSNRLIFYSWSFSSIHYRQMIARIKRKGQESPMYVTHLITKDTIDQEILDSVNKKLKLADKLI